MRSIALAGLLAALTVLALPAAGAADESDLIVLERGGRILAVHSDGSELTDLGWSGSAPALSPDGTRVAFVDGANVWVLDRSTRVRKLLRGTPGIGGGPVWSPDGTRVAFVSASTTGSPAGLDVATADGTGLVRVAADVRASYGTPSWSPAGDELAYPAVHGFLGDIAIARADGSGTRRLTNDDADDLAPSWSPTGRTIAFVRQTKEGLRLHLIEADGTALRQLSNTPVTTTYDRARPVWSHDGRRILFFDSTLLFWDRYGPVYASALRVVELGGGERLIGGGGDRPAFSDDGRRVLFNTGLRAPGEEDGLQAYVMNADGSCPSRVAAGTIGVQAWYASTGPALRCTDLQVSTTQDRTLVGIHEVAAFEITVANTGTEPATGARLDVDPPTNGRLWLSVAGSACPATGGGSCSLGTIPAGGSAKVVAVMQALDTGPVFTGVRARSNEPDRNQAANYGTLRFDSLPCSLVGTYDSDVLVGTRDADVVCALTGRDVIRALGGADTIDAGNGADRVFPGPGRDSVDLKGGADFVDARDGQRDVISCGAEADIALIDRVDAVDKSCEIASTTRFRCSILGTSRANTLVGSARRDSICAFSGNDTVDGGAGDDELDAGTGNDTVTGGAGKDLILGGAGNDLIRARDGSRDTIRCGSELDLVLADRIDAVAADCERMLRR
jgi:Tol biopolymer transport system component